MRVDSIRRKKKGFGTVVDVVTVRVHSSDERCSEVYVELGKVVETVFEAHFVTVVVVRFWTHPFFVCFLLLCKTHFVWLVSLTFRYILLTAIFWTLSVLNNMAYDYQISQPLHMVFRSSSLAVSLVLGFTVFKKTYNVAQVLGVAIVTAGIFVTTFADSKIDCGPNGCSAVSLWDFTNLVSWNFSDRKLIGIGLLLSGLVLSSLLGHLQSLGYELFKKKDVDEAMFFQHFLAIFFFAPLASSLRDHANLWSASEPYILGVPWLWYNVIGNLITQYICIRGVYLLIGNSGPVTATLVLTCRKFVSLIVSILLFNNPWTNAHWIGSSLVFGGTLIYSIEYGGGGEGKAKKMPSSPSPSHLKKGKKVPASPRSLIKSLAAEPTTPTTSTTKRRNQSSPRGSPSSGQASSPRRSPRSSNKK